MAFLDEQELDRVGVFTYSREDGTPAAAFENQIGGETATQWRNEVSLFGGIIYTVAQ